jgi:hypothetical protein
MRARPARKQADPQHAAIVLKTQIRVIAYHTFMSSRLLIFLEETVQR